MARQTVSARLRWWAEAKFGMFIHWGLYSQLQRGEWVMWNERIPAREYHKLIKTFNPRKSAVKEWIAVARQAGAKYVVLTSRHHEGFCLFDSKVSDFTSVKSPARRDIVAEFVDEARRAGLKVGLYYSLCDWRYKGCYGVKKYAGSATAMVRQCHDQVRELLTNYGKIDILWYDGAWTLDMPPDVPALKKPLAKFWRSAELNRMARELQPHLIINDRGCLPEDFDTPEQNLWGLEGDRAWELNLCVGARWGWGYIKHDPLLKTPGQLIEGLANSVCMGGNYLLNVGPRGDGSIDPKHASRLRELGHWLATYGEAIYGCRTWPSAQQMIGMTAVKDNALYYHISFWPGNEVYLAGLKNRIRKATLMSDGRSLRTRRLDDGRVLITGLPDRPPEKYGTVIKLELDGPARAIKRGSLGNR